MNRYFTFANPFIPGTLIRAEEFNSVVQSVETGFETLETVTPEFLGDFVSGTTYFPNKSYQDPVTGSLYIVLVEHVGTNIASDLAAGNIALVYDLTEFNAVQTAAFAARDAALLSETNAATSAANALTSETNAAASEAAALLSQTNAATSEANALASEQAAALSETNAATSAANALTSETNAATSAANALTSANNAATSATNAATSASNALTSENNAEDWASLTGALVESTDYSAKEWAIGETVTEGSAKYWSTLAQVASGFQGDYNPATTYTLGQQVVFNGARYVAKRTVTGVEPVDGPDWYEVIDAVQVLTNADNTDYPLVLSSSAVDGPTDFLIDTAGGRYNPSTNLASINISGLAADATRLNNQLASFYQNAGNLNAGTLPTARLSGTYPISITGNAASATSANIANTANTATNANNLNNQPGSFYQNAGNLNAGTVPTARLSGSYNINISGNAATATNAVTATNVSGGTGSLTSLTVSNAADFDGSVNLGSDVSDFINMRGRLALNGDQGQLGQTMISQGLGNAPLWQDIPPGIPTSANAVGSYALAKVTGGNSSYSLGQTIAGGNLSPVGIIGVTDGAAAPITSNQGANLGVGTWRCHGYATFNAINPNNGFGTTLWQRIA